MGMGMDTPGDAVTLWRRAVEALLDKGRTPAEALDGANLIISAYRRQHAQEKEPEQAPESGARRAG